MKRLLLTIMMLATICLGISAQDKTLKEKNDMKTLVAYFSASGTTKGIAQQLAKVAGADLHEIKPAKAYTRADLDWHDKQSRSSVEMADKNSRPAITDKLANMADYQTIYVGFPIWWYTAPTIINTFFESYDFSGKTVRLFATSGGSSIDKAVQDMKEAYPDINIQDGRLLNFAKESELRSFCEK